MDGTLIQLSVLVVLLMVAVHQSHKILKLNDGWMEIVVKNVIALLL